MTKWFCHPFSQAARVGSLKATLIINYDPTGDSRLVSTIAEQEGIKADPIEISRFIGFVKRNKLQTETFFIRPSQYNKLNDTTIAGTILLLRK
ncbi:hypothetical protein SASPL_133531 [Salvia splendens]|uniref:Uncharacterized protein n=1 Tax=Salvia splendens TaxID=180675 RepID=A0A8X8X3Z3_SALSN|nr:hypothetical protein SASPL_133531 [Salvia splendens]